jgi:hypothetical protein
MSRSSYGQTPKASSAYTALATGKAKSKTKSLALKHAIRDRYNSDKPYSHRSKMTQSDRDYQNLKIVKDREGIEMSLIRVQVVRGKPKGKKESKTGVNAESFNIDERALDATETKEKERIVKSMKDKASDFEKRYPGRGKEVMYATATKMAKIAEQPAIATATPDISKKKDMLDKQKFSNLKMLQQKKQQIDRQKIQMQRSGKLPLEASYQPEGEQIDERRRSEKGTPRAFKQIQHLNWLQNQWDPIGWEFNQEG